MWLQSLHVENFRGFESLDVTFDQHCTLLLGGNGAGKTAVLEAIVVAFGAFFSKIAQAPAKGIDASDARRVVFELGQPAVPDLQEQWPVNVAAHAMLGRLRPPQPSLPIFENPSIGWSRSREERGGRTSRADDASIRDLAVYLQDAVMTGQPVELPLVAYYGTQRLWREKRQTEAKHGQGNRLDGYIDCLDIGSSERFLRDWMRQKTYEEVQLQQANPGYRHPQLRAVVAAVERCIAGVTEFGFDLMHDEIRMRVGTTYQSFSMLSDGYRNMIAMVADIAERAAVLNPQLSEDAPQRTAGVVLIDEIELHLHPGWQRTVVPSLRRTFPELQFIGTTHSPQVVSTVERGQVRVFRDNVLIASDWFVRGRDSNELLEDIFGVSARPTDIQMRIDELFRLLDTDDYKAAQVKLVELQQLLGEDDADMVRARWILESENGSSTASPAAS